MNILTNLKLVVDNPSPNVVDASAASVGILAWLEWAPEVAGAFTVLWLGLRIFIALRDEIFGRKG